MAGAPDGAEGGRALETPEVELAGCAAIVAEEGDGADVRCEIVAGHELVLWLAPPDGADVEILVDGRAADARKAAVQAGVQWRVVPPVGARRLVVRLRRAGRSVVWEQPLAPAGAEPAIDEAVRLRGAGRLAEAEALLDGAQLPDGQRGRVAGLRARLALSRGQADAAIPLFREAIERNRGAGRLSDAVLDSVALAYTLYRSGWRFEEARSVLDGLEPLLGHVAEGRVHVPYHLGLIARATGDVRSALALLAEAHRRAERLGLDQLARHAGQVTATTLQGVGRSAEARALLAGLLAEFPADGDACERAMLQGGAAWAALLEAESAASRTSAPAPAPLLVADAGFRPRGPTASETDDRAPAVLPGPDLLLEDALSLYRGACRRPRLEASTLVDLALVALQRGDAAAARERLAAARRAVPSAEADVAAWRDELEARVALADGDEAGALRKFDGLATGRAATSPAALWRAHVGRARALAALGRGDDAIAAWRAAEDLLEELSVLVPLGAGRDTFLGDREASARGLVGSLVAAGRAAEALAATRRARARNIATLQRVDRLARLSRDERARWEVAIARYREAREALAREDAEDWKLPGDALARRRAARPEREDGLRRALDQAFLVLDGAQPRLGEPRPIEDGELLLAWYPLGDGWVGFAADGASVEQVRLGPIDPALPPRTLSDRLLGPFDARIAAASRIRVITYGYLDGIDVHALPWRDDVLLAQAPIVYGVDLAGGDLKRRSSSSVQGARRALVVSDSRGDLGGARREGASVIDALARSPGWTTASLRGAEATAPALLRALDGVDLLHFAGHGAFAGRGGWDSALRLADDGRLTVGDVLALRPTPRRVVLMGCETGRAARDAGVEGLGIAQAFVAAGADEVVAATRPVDDGEAAAIAAALYEGIAADGDVDLAAALRQAQNTVRRAHGGTGWASFRAFER